MYPVQLLDFHKVNSWKSKKETKIIKTISNKLLSNEWKSDTTWENQIQPQKTSKVVEKRDFGLKFSKEKVSAATCYSQTLPLKAGILDPALLDSKDLTFHNLFLIFLLNMCYLEAVDLFRNNPLFKLSQSTSWETSLCYETTTEWTWLFLRGTNTSAKNYWRKVPKLQWCIQFQQIITWTGFIIATTHLKIKNHSSY